MDLWSTTSVLVLQVTQESTVKVSNCKVFRVGKKSPDRECNMSTFTCFTKLAMYMTSVF